MTEKSMEEVLREIRDTCGMEMFGNGRRLISAFCDFSRVKKDQRLLRYFVESRGHTALLDACQLSPAMQQARLGQVMLKMCSETLVSEEAAQMVCHAFWAAISEIGVPSSQKMKKAPEAFEVDPGLEIDGDTVIGYKGNQTHVRIPAGIVNIGENAFWYNKTLTSVELPDGLLTIGKSAFKGVGLRDIRFPDSVQTIDTWGFSDTLLENIVLPIGLKDASAWSFGSCKKLRKVEFRQMPQRLHPFMFSGCDSLEEVVYAEGIETLNLDDFRRCKAFMRIHIPDSVNDIHCFFAKDEQLFEIVASKEWIETHQNLLSSNPNCTAVPSGK